MRQIMTIAVCAGLLAAPAAFADTPNPADPTSKFNQMMTTCMEQQDPAMNKEDARQLCKEKWKQGIKVGKPKKAKPKPPEASPGKETSSGKQPPDNSAVQKN
jgi:hypothetical protein